MRCNFINYQTHTYTHTHSHPHIDGHWDTHIGTQHRHRHRRHIEIDVDVDGFVVASATCSHFIVGRLLKMALTWLSFWLLLFLFWLLLQLLLLLLLALLLLALLLVLLVIACHRRSEPWKQTHSHQLNGPCPISVHRLFRNRKAVNLIRTKPVQQFCPWFLAPSPTPPHPHPHQEHTYIHTICVCQSTIQLTCWWFCGMQHGERVANA